MLIDRYILFIVGFKITRQILLIYLGKHRLHQGTCIAFALKIRVDSE